MILKTLNSANLLKIKNSMLHIPLKPLNFLDPFRISLTPDAKLQLQRPNKVPIHYRKKN